MPTSSYFGRNAFVALAKEADGSVYGTANTSYTVHRPIISCSMLRQVEKVPRNNLTVAGAHGLRKGHYIASDKATGSLEIEATYDNIGFFLHELMGHSSTSGGSPPYTHTYTLADLPAVGVGASNQRGSTLALQRGTGQVEVFKGVVFNNGTFSVAAGEQMTLAMDLIGATSNNRTTAITYTDPANENLVLHNQMNSTTKLAWNSQNFDLIDFEFKIENSIADRMRLGSLITAQPVVSDFRNITMTVNFETNDPQGYQKYLDDTSHDAQVQFTNGLGSGDERVMTFNLNKAYIESYEDSITETGLTIASVTFRAEGDGSSGLPLGASIVTMNGASTAVHRG